MKETRFFYAPDAPDVLALQDDEAAHALKVLRLSVGDELMLTNGKGLFLRTAIAATTSKHCELRLIEQLPQQRAWPAKIHLAIAPTKMMERMEWMSEKATEVGFDCLTFLDCRFSERRVIKTQRIEKIVVAAMKQSQKAWKPVVNEITPFKTFIANHTTGRRFIAHCYQEVDRQNLFELLQADPLKEGEECIVMVGPEGDFSIDEVRIAVEQGFVSVDLGTSRLRTETAGLTAVMMMQLSSNKK